MTDEPRDTSGHHKSFGMVDPDVLRDPTLGWAAKLVYSLLTTYCAKDRRAFPSRSRIAAELGISVRSVDAGIREARERGLIEVERRANSTGDWTSNLYHLRDLGGGFVGVRNPGGSAGDALPSAGRAPGSAGGADEVDHSSRPPGHTSSTSGDEVASSGPRTSSPTRMKILTGRNFDTIPDSQIAQRLIASSVGAVRKNGVELTDEAKSELGRALKAHVEDGVNRRELVKMLDLTLNDAWEGRSGWAWMFGWPRAA